MGIGWGLDPANLMKALPFALLIVVMWPLDGMAITTMHERNYAGHAKKVVFRLNPSFFVVSLRNIIGTVLGGVQTAAVWRSFLIPLGVVKRPQPAAALLLGLMGVIFSLAGYPIDLAMFPPLLHVECVVLITRK